MLRLSSVLLLAAPCKAPTAPLVALERRRAEFLFQTATFLSVTAGSAAFWWQSGHVLANGEAWEQEAKDLIVTAATEPLMRRLVFVPGELRFTFARLHSLFDDGTPASDRVEGGRAASERPPLAEALTSGSCRNWDREASGGWLYTRMTLAVPKSRRANEKRKRKRFSFPKRKRF